MPSSNQPEFFMTDSKKHLEAADSALSLVKTEAQLLAWHDLFMSSDDYAGMRDEDAQALEALYRGKAGWFWE
jgi:hypothetical protein